MLPAELLIAKRCRETIRPAYVSYEPHFMELAESMISVYEGGMGKKRSEIRSQLRVLEDGIYDFRLIRGLEALLERRSVFVTESPVDPPRLRRAVFSASGGFAATEGERQRILEGVAAEFGIAAGDVDRYLWGDLEDEQVMKDFEPISPMGLLEAYNLSLTQTLLFRSTVLTFRVKQNWKRIFRSIKFLNLMYSIEREGGREGASSGAGPGASSNNTSSGTSPGPASDRPRSGSGSGSGSYAYSVTVEGPTSMIKMTERYGTNLAKLIPEVIGGGEWEIRAQIVSRWKGEKRLLTFELSSLEGVPLPARTRTEEEYDSSLEESFARRFKALGTKWRILREPEPIPVGSTVMIPDFAFELGGRRIYLEIVGFWTPEYLKRKLAKLQEVGAETDLIVAADSSLGITRKLPGRVVFFEKEVPLKPILDELEAAEREELRREEEEAARADLKTKITGECVRVGDLAAGLGLSEDALARRLRDRPVEGYALVGDCLMSEGKLGELARIIAGERRLSALAPRLEAEGISDPFPLLAYLGYQVRWHGLDRDAAEVVREPHG